MFYLIELILIILSTLQFVRQTFPIVGTFIIIILLYESIKKKTPSHQLRKNLSTDNSFWQTKLLLIF